MSEHLFTPDLSTLKRHQIMDLFCEDTKEPIEMDWVNLNEKTPECVGKGCKLLVKTLDNLEYYAYFYMDNCINFLKHFNDIKKPIFFAAHSHNIIHDVTHYKYLKEPD